MGVQIFQRIASYRLYCMNLKKATQNMFDDLAEDMAELGVVKAAGGCVAGVCLDHLNNCSNCSCTGIAVQSQKMQRESMERSRR